MIVIPKRVFFTKGVGYHRNRLQSFESALRMAGIERCNLVSVSSILWTTVIAAAVLLSE